MKISLKTYLLVVALLVGGLTWYVKGQDVAKADKTRSEKPKPPAEISLTEVQRLKLENAQLKLNELRRQIAEIDKAVNDELLAAMKLAGVPESEYGNYGFTAQGRLVYVEPKTPVAPPASKK